ncbi:hypothetical protein [Bifidobacterium felsineum]|uniref:hypothetical protein n=1 Tax=Bifidobacterium felsineum TaxID=2045440 RepID=UPI001BDC615B|nr:hypothetical protein [Bifidobacterium felsineum]MBT1164654.1 hypothetical protein [Bifidobacterium felsineum]
MDDLEQLDDNTLFEVFEQSANSLTGTIAALQYKAIRENDENRSNEWLERQKILQKERLQTDWRNRQEQISRIREWDGLNRRLEGLL